jgi:hypothetical protein
MAEVNDFNTYFGTNKSTTHGTCCKATTCFKIFAIEGIVLFDVIINSQVFTIFTKKR